MTVAKPSSNRSHHRGGRHRASARVELLRHGAQVPQRAYPRNCPVHDSVHQVLACYVKPPAQQRGQACDAAASMCSAG